VALQALTRAHPHMPMECKADAARADPALKGAHSSRTIRFLDASLLIEFMFMLFYINLVFKHFKNNKKYIS
jgi:hypothetical protein